MTSQLRVLILSAEPPYPPTHGGARLRLFHLLRQLSDKHQLTLLTLLESPAERDYVPALQAYCRKVVALDAPAATHPTTWRDRLVAPFYRLAYTAEMAHAIRAELAAEDYDLVHVDTARMAVYSSQLTGQRKIISAIDSATLSYQSRLTHARPGLQALRLRYQLHTVRAFERKLYPQYDAGTVVAERDAAAIRELCPQLPVQVIPNGIDCEAYHPTPPATEEPGLLLFTGTMDYRPNVDAMVWFVHAILPLIQAAAPATRLMIVGRNPTDAIGALAKQPGVTVTGFAPSVQPYLSRAALFVCPLREGSGMKNKLLEAMAAGKGIVTTTEGASGLGATPGREYCIADDARSFAQTTLELLQNPDRRQMLGTAARDFVGQRYSWEKTGQLMHGLYQQVARK